ncbi:acetyltransferase, putative [Plasmodium malariae]|uniref:Acetyltransferase, putative n=1 Tax=Plasmodium malariae TaxID=5858 RepID=A0A1A8WRL9_PLAMA|nr:acetyltransferase, putative [Plasmodium malariae]
MTREFLTVDKLEDEEVENKSSFSLKKTDLQLEMNEDVSKENANNDEMHSLLNKNTIYQTLIINNKEIAIYQYKTFPKNCLKSVYELLSSELSEPYNIFLLKTILKNHSEISLMSLLDDDCVGTVISKIITKYKNDEPTTFGYICMIAVHKSLRNCGLG